MGGPDSPRLASWPPPQVNNKSQAAGQYVRPPNVPPIQGLRATEALTASPLLRPAAANGNAGASMVPRLTSTSCDLSVSLESVLGRFRNDVEASLRQFEKDMQLIISPRSLTHSGKTLATRVALDASSEETVEEEEEEQDAQQTLEIAKELTRRFKSSPDMHGMPSEIDMETPKSVPLSTDSAYFQGTNSLERLRLAMTAKRPTAYPLAKVDRCVLDLISEPPQNPLIEKMSQFQFNARPLFAQDSKWRKLATSKRYSVVRGIAVMVDTTLVIVETSLSTDAVASRQIVPRLEMFWCFAVILNSFFIFDMMLALALEFPRFDLVVGRTGMRSLNLFAIMQQTLVMIGDFSFPDGRFTSMFRSVVHRFSFLRVVRALVTLPRMGGKRLQQSIGELYIMIRALAGTLQPLVWCSCMCAFILSIFGTFLAESVARQISRLNPPTEVFPEESPQAMLLSDWGGTRRCMYSLLMTMLGGADWGDLFSTLVGYGSATDSAICFFVFICFTFIALLNTVTAVFIQCAFMRLDKDRVFAVQREVQEKQEYLLAAKAAFENMSDGEGKITQQDMVLYLQDPEARAAFQRLRLDTDQVGKLFLLMDTDTSDGITLQEFMTGCLRLRGAASCVHLEFLHQDLKFAIQALTEMMVGVQAQTEILTTPRSESQSSMKQVQQLGILQRRMRVLSGQLRELDITVQAGLSKSQTELDLDPEAKDGQRFSF